MSGRRTSKLIPGFDLNNFFLSLAQSNEPSPIAPTEHLGPWELMLGFGDCRGVEIDKKLMITDCTYREPVRPWELDLGSPLR